MVLIHAESTMSACSRMPAWRSVERTRSLISRAAALVKVMTRTWPRSSTNGASPTPEPGESAHAILRVRVNVLQEPAPASTKTGRSSVETIWSWRSLRVERSMPDTRRASSRSS